MAMLSVMVSSLVSYDISRPRQSGTINLDTAPFLYWSSHAYVMLPLPQSMLFVMFYSLLLSLARGTFILTLIGGREGRSVTNNITF